MELNYPDPVQALRDDTREFLHDTQTSQIGLAKLLQVTPQCINQFLSGERGVSVETYYKLARIIHNPSKNVRIVHAQENGSPRPGLRHVQRVQFQIRKDPSAKICLYEAPDNEQQRYQLDKSTR
jgi:hypothetical protein